MKTLMTIAAALLLAVGDAGSEPPIVKNAIQNFERPWTPERGEMTGWVVRVDALGDVSAKQAERTRADLAMLTAGHLYHFVRQAGGHVVLTRPDDSRVLEDTIDPQSNSRVRIGLRCDAKVTQPTIHARTSETDTEKEKADDLALAEALASAFEGQVGPALPNDPQHRDARPGPIAACEIVLPTGEAPAVDVDARRSCMADARRVYAGLHAFCAKRSPNRGETPPTPASVPDEPDSERPDAFERLASRIHPSGKLTAKRATWFCERFKQTAISNSSLVYLNVRAEPDGDAIVLRGQTNRPQIVPYLVQSLNAAGLTDVRDEIETLPSHERLGAQMFGVCRVRMALTYTRPSRAGGLQTQVLFGEPAWLLDRRDGAVLLHSSDGYWGWVGADAIEPMDETRFAMYLAYPRGVAVTDITTTDGAIEIPRGARLAVVRATGDACVILLPDGSETTVPASAVAVHADSDSHTGAATDAATDAAAARRAEAGLDLLYVPYLFGGRSPLGLDCSGLVSNVWTRTGERPARDAWQQALAGELSATAWRRDGIRAGDQLFFINDFGRIYHTGVAISPTHFVHSSPPCVQIGSFDESDRLYDAYLARRFFMAKRP